MTAKTQELLYFLSWTADTLLCPTFRNLDQSFEAWFYRNGLYLQLCRLERAHLLERRGDAKKERQYRLTPEGRRCTLGGRDPVERWNRAWDGRWRLVVFDMPEERAADRAKLRRLLYSQTFGCLQKSVWVTPDPLDEMVRSWRSLGRDPASLMTFDAKPGAGELDQAIVAAAWDFAAINRLYEGCLETLDKLPAAQGRSPEQLLRWARLERAAWLEAVAADPLLPNALLPVKYLGKTVWQRRAEVLGEAREAAG